AEEKPTLADAAASGSVALVCLMLERGADVNEFDPDYGTPLHSAAWRGHRAVARALIDAGARVDVWTEPEWQHLPESHLPSAGERGDAALVQLLLAAGASTALGEPEAAFIDTYGVVILPLYRARDPQTIALLLDEGADPDVVRALPPSDIY